MKWQKNSIYATLSDQRDKQVSAMHSTVTKLGETRRKATKIDLANKDDEISKGYCEHY